MHDGDRELTMELQIKLDWLNSFFNIKFTISDKHLNDGGCTWIASNFGICILWACMVNNSIEDAREEREGHDEEVPNFQETWGNKKVKIMVVSSI